MSLSLPVTPRQPRLALGGYLRYFRRLTTARDAFLAAVLIVALQVPQYGAFSFDLFVAVAGPLTLFGAGFDCLRDWLRSY